MAVRRVSAVDSKISRRLKDALIADLVMDLDRDDATYWLDEQLKEEHEWTYHLGRQLEIHDVGDVAGTHDTLMVLVRELDELIRDWPPRYDDGRTCRELAHEATKHLSPVELGWR
jgi:hypothetical protein